MPFLSPVKLLVVLVVALVVLGPDKLPKVARQVGSVWRDLRTMRERLESGVRDNFPDLPSTERITQAVRSPLSFLDGLADSPASPVGRGAASDAGAPAGADGALGEVPLRPADGYVRSAGRAGVTADPPGDVVTVVDPRGTVHRVRAPDGVAHDDADLN
jgi:TatA/E family protein of Tat protein translocase